MLVGGLDDQLRDHAEESVAGEEDEPEVPITIEGKLYAFFQENQTGRSAI